MAGDRDAFERQPADVDRLAALEQVIGRVRAAGHAGRGELGVALEPVALSLRHVHGSAGSLGQVGDAADVVEVAVRDQDRAAGRAEPRELEAQLGGVAAGIDDDRLGRVAARAHDVAVRLQRAERVCVDDDGHAGECNGVMCSASRPGYIGCVQHWKLNEIETPDGTRSPVVLHSQKVRAASC